MPINFTMAPRRPLYTCRLPYKVASYSLIVQPGKLYPHGHKFNDLTHAEAREMWMKLDDKDNDCLIGFEYAHCPECGNTLEYGDFRDKGGINNPEYEASLHCVYDECVVNKALDGRL